LATYAKQMQDIVAQYRLAGKPWPAATKTIADWAIRAGLWQLPASAALNKCAEDIASAMREEYTTDSKGRRVRLKHPVTRRENGQQMVFWDDLRTAPRSHMLLSFQQRRQGIVSDCWQMKMDVESYNDLRPNNPPIQVVFDFTMDLAEKEAAAA
jgi:hypothetical protein